jgi:hypothetical protein
MAGNAALRHGGGNRPGVGRRGSESPRECSRQPQTAGNARGDLCLERAGGRSRALIAHGSGLYL